MRKANGSSLLKYASIALAVVSLLSAFFFCLLLWEQDRGKAPVFDPEEPVIEYGGQKYQRNPDIETFLVLGLDKTEGSAAGESYNNDQQADFLMLFVLDHAAETCCAISINRDTMTDVNILGVAGNRVGTVQKQIALAHTYGNGREVSCRNTADAVSALLLGIKVDHYMSVTMDAVPVCNDLLGGVEVEILDDFSGVDDSLVQGRKITLNGQQALTYLQARANLADSTNIARMKRQRQYLTAAREKAMQLIQTDEDFPVRLVSAIADCLVSDRSVTQLQALFQRLSAYEFTEIYDIEGCSRAGQQFMEFYADRAFVEQLVVRLFYQQQV